MKQVPVEELAAGMVLEQDIYATGRNTLPLLAKDVVLTRGHIELLKKQGVETAYVAGDNTLALMTLPPPKPVLAPALRVEALHNLQELYAFFQQDNPDRHHVFGIVKQLDTIVEQMVNTLQADKNALVHIADLKSYDEYTYHHSLSVAVLSIAIGQALKLDTADLNELGKCAMMHDIGKTAIPLHIINKPSTLNQAEFDIVKRHSPEGYQYLSKFDIDDVLLLSGVLFHHEKFDGNGYPYGLKGDKIPLFSRIISAADVYDALTSHRSYRMPQPPAEAVEYIMGNSGQAFDPDIVRALLKKLELYPVGSLVRLSNGQVATVLDNKYALRPRVQVLENGAELNLYRDKSCLNLTIKNIVPLGE